MADKNVAVSLSDVDVYLPALVSTALGETFSCPVQSYKGTADRTGKYLIRLGVKDFPPVPGVDKTSDESAMLCGISVFHRITCELWSSIFEEGDTKVTVANLFHLCCIFFSKTDIIKDITSLTRRKVIRMHFPALKLFYYLAINSDVKYCCSEEQMTLCYNMIFGPCPALMKQAPLIMAYVMSFAVLPDKTHPDAVLLADYHVAVAACLYIRLVGEKTPHPQIDFAMRNLGIFLKLMKEGKPIK